MAGLTADAKRALLEYNWPGKVRELRNALERAAILCEGGLIAPQRPLLPTTPPNFPSEMFAETQAVDFLTATAVDVMD